MSALATLSAALLADPGDAAGWLALADCLEEEGREDEALLLRLRQRLLDAHSLTRTFDEPRLRGLLASGVPPPVPVLTNTVGMRFVPLPPGSFAMGSDPGEVGRHPDEGPRHVVRLTRGVLIGQAPVTQAQYSAVLKHNPSHFAQGHEGGPSVSGMDTSSFPVERISWHDASELCWRLSLLEPGRRYRLPTEAEWEYACRAGTTTTFHFGQALTSDRANIDGGLPEGGAPRGPYLARTTAVASYPPNAFGLYDMHGNVWEWCLDWFDEGYYAVSPAESPTGPAFGVRKALRGGGWFYGARICRSAYRYRYEPEARHNDFGLRIVLEAG
jgi:uncharacterized protein (TIGR02996 family)